MTVNGCEVKKEPGRNPAWKVYAPPGEHFKFLDTHVLVEWSKDLAKLAAAREPREVCPADCYCREDES